MNQERFFGKIFFPDFPEEKITGIWLYIKDNTIVLETPLSSYTNKKWNTILGEFTGMDEVTFVNCYSGGGSSGMGGEHLDIQVSYLIKGFHAFKDGDLTFKKIILTSPALTKWVIEKERITYSLDYKTFQLPGQKEIVKVKTGDIDISIDLYFDPTIKTNELRVIKVCDVTIESNSLLEIKEFDKIMRHLKKLILFLTNKNPEFKDCTLFDNENHNYELLNTNNNLKDNEFTQGIHIAYWHIKEYFPIIIEKWFELKKLQPVIDLILERCFNTGMSPRGFYLSICMAIEIFQNNFGRETEEILDTSVSLNREKILSKIEDVELRVWFEGKSKHWNNPSFKNRLIEFDSDIAELINGVFNLTYQEFISKIVNTRNDIVHRGDYKKNIFTPIELLLATKVIEFALKLRMMQLMGIDTRKPPDSLFGHAHATIKVLASINKIFA